MWSRLAHAAVRLLILAFVGGALASFARLPHVPWSFSIPVALIALLTAWRPLDGLVAVAAFIPIATVASQLAGTYPFRTAEVVALAGLAGWFARTAFDRTWPVPRRVRTPAIWFAIVVAASAVVQLAVVQVQRDYPGAFLWSFFRWLTEAYVTDYTSFRSLHEAALLLEGVGLFAAATAACLRAPARAAPLRRMLVAGATAAAALNIVRLAASAIRTETPLESLWTTLHWVRLNVHFGDVNAAGSQFALALMIACGLAVSGSRAARVIWGASAAALAAALWLAGSRTAYAGFLAAFVCWIVVAFIAPRWPRAARPALLLPMAAAIVLTTILGILLLARSSGDVQRAVGIRTDLARIAWHMTETRPVFGIGIGRFYPESGRYLTPLLRSFYTNENAHNNFLQILAELGFAGLILFAWLLAWVLVPALRGRASRTAEQTATTFGLVGFLLTALGGHPLVIHEVAFTFWLALAAVAADTGPAEDAVPAGTMRRRLAAVLIVVIAASVVLRARRDRNLVDLEHVTYGLGDWQNGREGERYRTARGEATFFVHRDRHDVFRFELPLRVERRQAPVRIDVDGRRVLGFQLAPGTWRTVALTIGPDAASIARVTVRANGEFKTGATRAKRIGPLWRWGDVDGDRRADISVYRPSTREWFSTTSSSGYQGSVRFLLGDATGVPVARDFDGDAIADPALFNRDTGVWNVALSTTKYAGRKTVQWGIAGDIAVPADYDGDDKADYAVFRPSDGTWAITLSTNNLTISVRWGLPTDIPVPADYDGDGTDDIAVYRPPSGTWLIRDPSGGAKVERSWGLPDDIPVPADYDGDLRADLAVFRPSRGSWHVLSSDQRTSTSIDWGLPGDVPMPADFDGDRKADLTVFRPSSNRWYVRNILQRDWGMAGDIPVPQRSP